MTPRTVAILAVAAALSVGAATAAYLSNHPTIATVGGAGERLFPALVDDVNKVVEVTVTEGKETITAKLKEGAWLIAESGYPADREKVGKLIVELARMTRLEPKTDNPAKYPLLEVDAPGQEGAKGRLVTLKDEKGATLAELLVGKQAAGQIGGGREAQYVRLPSEAASWLVEGSIEAGPDLQNFADTTLISLSPEDIAAAKFVRPDGTSLEIKRTGKDADGSPKYEVVGLPPGKTLKSETEPRFAAIDIANIEFIDVRPAKAAMTPVTRAELETAKGMKLGFGLTGEGGKSWLSLDVLAPGSDKAAADGIAAKAKGWQFALDDFKAKQFKKTLPDLLATP